MRELKYGDGWVSLIEGIPANVLYIGRHPDSGKHIIIGKRNVNYKERIFARSFKDNETKLNFEELNPLEEEFVKKILNGKKN